MTINANYLGVEYNLSCDDNRVRPALSEVNRLYGDNHLISTLTDWTPQFSGINGFERGLQATIDWFSESSNLRLYKKSCYGV